VIVKTGSTGGSYHWALFKTVCLTVLQHKTQKDSKVTNQILIFGYKMIFKKNYEAHVRGRAAQKYSDWAMRWATGIQFPVGAGIFLFTSASILAHSASWSVAVGVKTAGV
jgi:hypothetical protein